MGDVFFLPLPPGRPRRFIAVGASGHDLAHFFSETLFDFSLPLRTTARFNRVVQEGGDCFGFVGPVFEGDGGDPEEVPMKGIFVLRRSSPLCNCVAQTSASSNFGESFIGYFWGCLTIKSSGERRDVAARPTGGRILQNCQFLSQRTI